LGRSSIFARLLFTGETVEETMNNVKEAVEAHILALKEEDEKIPEEEDFIIARINVAKSIAA